jgi:type I restriction enzyme S subunit
MFRRAATTWLLIIKLRRGDILMTKDGTIGKLLYIDQMPFLGKATLNSHLLLFRPLSDSYNPKYVYYRLASQRFQEFVELNKSGSTFFGLSQAAVARYPMLLPPREDQNRIASVLTDIDDDIGVLEKQLTKARQIREGMMQELLTGRVRLI